MGARRHRHRDRSARDQPARSGRELSRSSGRPPRWSSLPSRRCRCRGCGASPARGRPPQVGDQTVSTSDVDRLDQRLLRGARAAAVQSRGRSCRPLAARRTSSAGLTRQRRRPAARRRATTSRGRRATTRQRRPSWRPQLDSAARGPARRGHRGRDRRAYANGRRERQVGETLLAARARPRRRRRPRPRPRPPDAFAGLARRRTRRRRPAVRHRDRRRARFTERRHQHRRTRVVDAATPWPPQASPTRRTPPRCRATSAAAEPMPTATGEPLARVPRRHAPAAGRVRLEARADPRSLRALPRRGDLGDARGDRLRRPRRTCARSSATCCCRSCFHAVIAEEAGAFTFDDVASGIVDKLRRRNPHVFDPEGEPPPSRDAAVGQRAVGVGQGDRRSRAPRSSTACRPACPPCCSPTRCSTGPSGRVTPPSLSPTRADLGDRLLALVAEARAAGVDPEHALRDAVRRAAPR